MPAVRSKDGTSIVFDKTGKGPCILLVNGALSHRKFYGEQELAARLADYFTVIFYDRRGRGESTDTKPYTTEKEIEDIDALIHEAGGKVYLYGISSGAALALHATGKLGPEKILKLALYEPPYDSNKDKEAFEGMKNNIQKLVAAGKPGDAVAFFMKSLGTPAETIEGMKKSAEWKDMEHVGHTLVYDFAILGDGEIPVHVVKNITLPTLILDGEKSFGFMHTTSQTIMKMIPGASQKTLKGQTHEVSPEVLAPVLKDFFMP